MISIGDVMKNGKKRAIIIGGSCLVIIIGGFILDKVLSKSYLVELEYTEVIEKIENDESFVILISQTTCSHCADYKPKLEKVAKDYKLDIYFVEVDLLSKDKYNEFKSYVNFSSTPVTIFIKDGEEKTAANRINGDASKEKILAKLKSNGFIE